MEGFILLYLTAEPAEGAETHLVFSAISVLSAVNDRGVKNGIGWLYFTAEPAEGAEVYMVFSAIFAVSAVNN